MCELESKGLLDNTIIFSKATGHQENLEVA